MFPESKIESTGVLRKRIDTDTWEDMTKEIGCETSWGRDHEVFVYSESLEACLLERCPFGSVAALDTPFEGRVFDSGAEARWRFLPQVNKGKWTAWITREDVSKGDRARRVVRRYYLRGVCGSDGHFHEARYPHVRFRYPVSGGRHQDRAYVEVAEYWRAEPDWSRSEVDAAQELSLPLLFAHRFCGVGVGLGRHEEKYEEPRAR